jgi:hemerythrin-like domain-containing protein
MKRHPAFAPLSRDHHRTLILAQSIKKRAPQFRGMATTIEGKREEIISHFEDHLKDHFRKEEKIFAECRNISPQVNDLFVEIIAEHREIEKLISDLKAEKEIDDTLNALGHLLEKHIRKEERTLFELLQEKLSQEMLNHIAAELSA